MTELEAVQKLLQRPETPQHPVIVELGAHHGNDTQKIYRFSKQTPSLYLALEAEPENAKILKSQCKGWKNLHTLAVAIGARNGEATLYVSQGSGNGSSSLRKPTKHISMFPHIRFTGTITVPTITLDSLMTLYNRPPIDLLWCDIQGSERDMIEQGRETLRNTRYLMIEAERIDIYEGQATRPELFSMLGSNWEVMEEWLDNANALLRNKNMTVK